MNETEKYYYDKAYRILGRGIMGVYGDSAYDESHMTKKQNAVVDIPANYIEKIFEFARKTIGNQPKEIPFMMTSHLCQRGDDKIHIQIDEMAYDSEDLREREANYGSLNQWVNRKVSNNENRGDFMLIQGHTHPMINGTFYDYFSVKDLANLIQLSETFNVLTAGFLITPGGKCLFSFYNPEKESFRQITNFLECPALYPPCDVSNERCKCN